MHTFHSSRVTPERLFLHGVPVNTLIPRGATLHNTKCNRTGPARRTIMKRKRETHAGVKRIENENDPEEIQ